MIELESTDSPEIILARVREVLPPMWQLKDLEQSRENEFYGGMHSMGFWVMARKSRFERNMFNPVLAASVAPTPRGSRITANVRIPYPIQFIVAGWCVLVCAIGSKAVYEIMTQQEPINPIVPTVFALAIPTLLFIVGIWYALARMTMNQRRPKLEAWVRDVIENNHTNSQAHNTRL